MDSSEHDDAMETPANPAEPEFIDLADATAPAPVAPVPAPPAEPGMYVCEVDDPGIHPILGQIAHGENDYSGVTHPDSLQAIGDLVAAGVLRKA